MCTRVYVCVLNIEPRAIYMLGQALYHWLHPHCWFLSFIITHLYSFNNPKAHGIHSGNHSCNKGFWNVATMSQEPNQEATGALCLIYTLIFINQLTVKYQKKGYLFLTRMCRCQDKLLFQNTEMLEWLFYQMWHNYSAYIKCSRKQEATYLFAFSITSWIFFLLDWYSEFFPKSAHSWL